MRETRRLWFMLVERGITAVADCEKVCVRFGFGFGWDEEELWCSGFGVRKKGSQRGCDAHLGGLERQLRCRQQLRHGYDVGLLCPAVRICCHSQIRICRLRSQRAMEARGLRIREARQLLFGLEGAHTENGFLSVWISLVFMVAMTW